MNDLVSSLIYQIIMSPFGDSQYETSIKAHSGACVCLGVSLCEALIDGLTCKCKTTNTKPECFVTVLIPFLKILNQSQHIPQT